MANFPIFVWNKLEGLFLKAMSRELSRLVQRTHGSIYSGGRLAEALRRSQGDGEEQTVGRLIKSFRLRSSIYSAGARTMIM